MSKCNCIKNKKIFNPVISSINLKCEETWKMISDGNTLGCFQLESFLGQKLASDCKPKNIEELAEVISVMRPGCLEATLEDGKTVTQHYIKRKNKQEEVNYLTFELEPILKNTYGLLLYQEQAMKIATDIANFNMTKADTLRKSIGKKDVKLMAELKEEFIRGATKNVGKDVAEKIFDGIEKSQRYSFNKSHAIGYAYNCYISAYTKCHFPELFFVGYCNNADTISEIACYINNARGMGIEIVPPRLNKKNINFICEPGKIFFGLSYIKGLSESKLKPLLEKEMAKSWEEFLIHYSSLVDSTTIQNLIKVGALSSFGIGRERMLYEYNIFRKITDGSLEYIQKTYRHEKLSKILEEIINQPTGMKYGCKTSTSQKKYFDLLKELNSPPFSLLDNPAIIGKYEFDILGMSFTSTELDICSISMANCTCKDYVNGFKGINGIILLPINIKSFNEIVTKRGINPGQKMCFITGYDEESEVNMVVFPDTYAEYHNLIFNNNTIMVKGKIGKDNILNVEKIWQI